MKVSEKEQELIYNLFREAYTSTKFSLLERSVIYAVSLFMMGFMQDKGE